MSLSNFIANCVGSLAPIVAGNILTDVVSIFIYKYLPTNKVVMWSYSSFRRSTVIVFGGTMEINDLIEIRE